ncbi:torsin-1B isoform X2 [Oryzias melastigma]|uniref:torsin-1B isoform X2 n=1 Tax=Oryzias melastigma TaxID=30732 RepID=UPI00168D6DA0|nr:torsin-1B isoform X2 [Oryzias melastigma]
MGLKKGHVLLLWVLVGSGGTGAIESVSIASAVCLAAGFLAGYLPSHLNTFNIRNEEMGKSFDNTVNLPRLKTDLDNKLFGQHLASRIILRAVVEFMSNNNPEKPLVLSLHGPPGTGKNLVSQLIAKNIYTEGMNSKSVHVFSPYRHFPRRIQISTYKSYLQQRIKSSVSNFERSMFIFDQMDKMHPGLIDSIRPYLDGYDELGGVSFRKSIFIFLSTAGEDSIIQTALDFWKAGRVREEIDLKDIETSLYRSVFNDKIPACRPVRYG